MTSIQSLIAAEARRFSTAYRNYADERYPVIYQMGKVGSTTLEASIDGALHAHSFFGKDPCHVRGEQIRRNSVRKGRQTALDLLKRRGLRRRSTIQLLVPIRRLDQRNVSMFFHSLAFWIYKHIGRYGAGRQNDAQELKFLEEVFYQSFDHDYGANWFDDEFRRLTGINIYDHPFDPALGYVHVRSGQIDALIFHSEQMVQVKPVLESALSREIRFSMENVGDEKWYAPVYSAFRERGLSEDYLDSIRGTRFMRHFYEGE